jgi:hypothetical protein
MRQSPDGIAAYDATVVEYLLELDRRFRALVGGQVGLTAEVDRVERTE